MRLQRTGCSFCIKVVFYTRAINSIAAAAIGEIGPTTGGVHFSGWTMTSAQPRNDVALSGQGCGWLAAALHGRMQHTACTEHRGNKCTHCTCGKYLFQTNSSLIILGRLTNGGVIKQFMPGVRLSMAPLAPRPVN
jgi:hypothetical protein